MMYELEHIWGSLVLMPPRRRRRELASLSNRRFWFLLTAVGVTLIDRGVIDKTDDTFVMALAEWRVRDTPDFDMNCDTPRGETLLMWDVDGF